MLDVLYDPAWTSQFYWLLIVAFVFAFSVSFGMGANDSCNDWGPAVGAGTVKLWQAYILCGIFNTIGAILLGQFHFSSVLRVTVTTSLRI
ncbi:hypothetical protein COOONC_14273 [Cooperia oncophora]